MPKKPRDVQPWSSVAAARSHLADALGPLEANGYLRSVEVAAGYASFLLQLNALRRYKKVIVEALDGLKRMRDAHERFGIGGDEADISEAVRLLSLVESRHARRIEPPAERNPDGSVRYQLPSQLPQHLGHGAWLEDPAERRAFEAVEAARGAVAWFERCESEGQKPKTPLGGALLFVTAVAIGIEEPSRDSNSLRGGRIDVAQRRWAKRLRLAREGVRSQFSRAWGGDWTQLSRSDQVGVKAEIARLRKIGRPVEARSRELSFGLLGDSRNRR